MPRILPLLFMVVLIAAGCSGESDESGADGQVAEDGDLVEVHYVGTLDDGSQFDSSRERGSPFAFTVGEGVIEGFSKAVRGMEVGEIKTVRMPPEDAYGQPDPDLVYELPLGEGQGDIEVGETVTLSNGRPGVIIEVRDGIAVVDANSPLAGEALTFEIQLLSITRPGG